MAQNMELPMTMPDANTRGSRSSNRNVSPLTNRRKRTLMIVSAIVPFVVAVVALAAVLSNRSESKPNIDEIVVSAIDGTEKTKPEELDIVYQMSQGTTSSGATQISQTTNTDSVSELSSDVLLSTTTTGVYTQSTIHSRTGSSTMTVSDSDPIITSMQSTAYSDSSSTATEALPTTTSSEIMTSFQTTENSDASSLTTEFATISSTPGLSKEEDVNIATSPTGEADILSTLSATTSTEAGLDTTSTLLSTVASEMQTIASTESSSRATNATLSFTPELTTTSISTKPVGSSVYTTLATTTKKSTLHTTLAATPSSSSQWISSIPSIDGQFPFPVPFFRYQPFGRLSRAKQRIAMSQLHYKPVTWNAHGGNVFASIEKKRWDELDTNEQEGAKKLGFSQDSWDCFINHYTAFTWDDLPTSAKLNYRILGWTRSRWDIKDRPSSESKWWHELTSAEQSAASGVCYFEANWNSIDMNPNPSYFPYAPPPMFRYVPWSELPPASKQTATDMMHYTMESWDKISGSSVETNNFYDLDPEERAGAMKLGYYPHMWDCHINHWDSWYWKSFYGELKIAVKALGWTQNSWDNGINEPDTENKVWAQLTPTEKAGATMLCFFDKTWDGIEDITQWYDFERSVTAISFDGPLPEGIDMSIFEQ